MGVSDVAGQGATGMKEAAVKAAILRAFNNGPYRLFNNPVGLAFAGKDKSYPIRYGLCPGSADLIGWTEIDGRAIFTAIEVKGTDGKAREDQLAFGRTVQRMGGIWCLARCVEDVEQAIVAWKAQHGHT